MGVRFTPRELDVMGILWDLGEASVHEVRKRLDEDLAYTSVLSALQLLEKKGHVGHRREGRAYRYFALTPAEEAGETLLDRALDRLYQSSPVKLVAHLLDSDRVTADDLEEIREILDERLREDDKEAGGGNGPSGRGGRR